MSKASYEQQDLGIPDLTLEVRANIIDKSGRVIASGLASRAIETRAAPAAVVDRLQGAVAVIALGGCIDQKEPEVFRALTFKQVQDMWWEERFSGVE